MLLVLNLSGGRVVASDTFKIGDVVLFLLWGGTSLVISLVKGVRKWGVLNDLLYAIV